jgi:hypothetical protein
MSTAKRVYFYLVYFITLGMFSSGVGILLGVIFNAVFRQPSVVGTESFSKGMLSLGLATLVIGGVLWFLFWRAIQRNVAGDAAEIGSAMRKFFLNLILVASALTGLSAAVGFLKWLMAGVPLNEFPSTGLATLIVTGVIWYYHWRLSEGEGQPSPEARTLRRWYVYILSGWGLVALAVGLVQLVNMAVLQLPVWGAIISRPFWGSSVQGNIGWILMGGVAWGFHWFRMAKGDSDSALRQVYLYLLAIVGGSIAGLVALAKSLSGVFRLALGSLSTPANTYFQFLGWAVSLILVATAIWVYHQRITQEEAVQVPERLSARRVHLYLMAFLGLATMIAGLIMLFGILIELLIGAVSSNPIVVTQGWWRDQLSICLALLVVATPIWLYYWNRVLKIASAGGAAERGAMSRRIFLYVVLGAAVVALAADLVNIVYQMLNGLLQGTFGVEVLRRSKWSLQTLFIVIPLLLYFWQILRQDQRLGAELAVRKTVTMLVSDQQAGLVSRIEEKLGYRVKTLHYVGQMPEEVPALSDEEASRLASEIQAAPGTKVMLVASAGRVIVLPYREK